MIVKSSRTFVEAMIFSDSGAHRAGVAGAVVGLPVAGDGGLGDGLAAAVAAGRLVPAHGAQPRLYPSSRPPTW